MWRTALLSVILAPAAQAQTVEKVRVLTPVVKQHERAEIALALDPGKANPFDPESIALDAVSDLCDRHAIRWQLCFEQVVWWNRKMPHRWLRNPYNAANGGPCKVPADYLSSPQCRDLAARRHRYSVARVSLRAPGSK